MSEHEFSPAAALTAFRPRQDYGSRMDGVLASMQEIKKQRKKERKRKGPVERPCLVEEMQDLTSLQLSSQVAIGTTPHFFLCKINGLH